MPNAEKSQGVKITEQMLERQKNVMTPLLLKARGKYFNSQTEQRGNYLKHRKKEQIESKLRNGEYASKGEFLEFARRRAYKNKNNACENKQLSAKLWRTISAQSAGNTATIAMHQNLHQPLTCFSRSLLSSRACLVVCSSLLNCCNVLEVCAFFSRASVSVISSSFLKSCNSVLVLCLLLASLFTAFSSSSIVFPCSRVLTLKKMLTIFRRLDMHV